MCWFLHSSQKMSPPLPPMTVAQQGPLRHLCSRHITYTHYRFSPLKTHTHISESKIAHKHRKSFFISESLYFLALLCSFIVFFHTYYPSLPANVTRNHQLSVTQWMPPPLLEVSHVETLFHIPHQVNNK